VGNWLGSPSSYGIGAGVYRTTTGYFQLRNTLDTSVANNAFFYGNASDLPVVGAWGNLSGPLPPPASPSVLVPRTPSPTAPRTDLGSAPGGNQLGG